MKILFISNFYPPHHIGGYGMLCKETVDGLARRGHEARVLTSIHGLGREMVDGHVHRLLRLESALDFYQVRAAFAYPAVKRRNLQHVRDQVAAFRPDRIFIWGMWCLDKEVAAEAERLLGERVAYYMANPWPIEANMHQAYWDEPARRPWRWLAKRGLRLFARAYLSAEWRRPSLKMANAPCCSAALRDQLRSHGVDMGDTPVIFEGIDLVPYLAEADRRIYDPSAGPLRLLYVGILASHKGVHTTIEAVQALPNAIRERVALTILGSGHPSYEARLHELVARHKLQTTVTFHEPIPREELPAFLGRHDVLLLSSVWEEPLARIMQEGLAAGMVVIGTATGGTKEIIVHGENGLLFAPEDSAGLAALIESLLERPALYDTLSSRGRATAADLFDIERMVDDLEAYLLALGMTVQQ